MNRKEACKAISFILIFVLLLTGVSYIVRTNGDIKDRFAGFYAEEKNIKNTRAFKAGVFSLVRLFF